MTRGLHAWLWFPAVAVSLQADSAVVNLFDWCAIRSAQCTAHSAHSTRRACVRHWTERAMPGPKGVSCAVHQRPCLLGPGPGAWACPSTRTRTHRSVARRNPYYFDFGMEFVNMMAKSSKDADYTIDVANSLFEAFSERLVPTCWCTPHACARCGSSATPSALCIAHHHPQLCPPGRPHSGESASPACPACASCRCHLTLRRWSEFCVGTVG